MNETIFALGFFDGVHIGHQALLKECQRLAAEHHCAAGAVTFSSHPDALVLGAAPVLINTPADRERLLRRHVQQVVTLPFDRAMLDTPWERFLDMLRERFHAAGFVCGDDFHFGFHGSGNGALMQDYCRSRGLPCAVVPEQTVNGTRVSSTHIRALLEAGKMEEAVRFLGHPHILTGTVVHGHQLGRTLGIPTANLCYPAGLIEPRHGVYATRIVLAGTPYVAVTNVGLRPTVSGSSLNVESWILNYQGDLYGQELTVEFLHFLRPERKFASLEEMQQEIRKNAQEALLLAQEDAHAAGSVPTPSGLV